MASIEILENTLEETQSSSPDAVDNTRTTYPRSDSYNSGPVDVVEEIEPPLEAGLLPSARAENPIQLLPPGPGAITEAVRSHARTEKLAWPNSCQPFPRGNQIHLAIHGS